VTDASGTPHAFGSIMRFCILMGSPRLGGNTAEMCARFIERAEELNIETEYICLSQLTVKPCLACYACQNVGDSYGCVQKDDMWRIVDAIRSSDCIVLATPIFSWYCTAQMKAVLDRHYGLNKFYGSAKGSLWAGKHVAIIATHGYEQDYALEPFVTGVRRLCEHSSLVFDGFCSVRDTDDLASFQTEEAISGVRTFVDRLANSVK